MFFHILLPICISLSYAISNGGSYIFPNGFVSNFDSIDTGGVSGVFQYYVNKYGQGEYSWDLTMDSNFEFSAAAVTAGCSMSNVKTNGLKYHIHTYWTNTTASSNQCGTATTGTENHYDPYLACSASSQYINSLCVNTSRTAAKGYTYGCNPTVYANGSYALCEVGDISSKFGNMMATGDTTLSKFTSINYYIMFI